MSLNAHQIVIFIHKLGVTVGAWEKIDGKGQ